MIPKMDNIFIVQSIDLASKLAQTKNKTVILKDDFKSKSLKNGAIEVKQKNYPANL